MAENLNSWFPSHQLYIVRLRYFSFHCVSGLLERLAANIKRQQNRNVYLATIPILNRLNNVGSSMQLALHIRWWLSNSVHNLLDLSECVYQWLSNHFVMQMRTTMSHQAYTMLQLLVSWLCRVVFCALDTICRISHIEGGFWASVLSYPPSQRVSGELKICYFH